MKGSRNECAAEQSNLNSTLGSNSMPLTDEVAKELLRSLEQRGAMREKMGALQIAMHLRIMRLQCCPSGYCNAIAAWQSLECSF